MSDDRCFIFNEVVAATENYDMDYILELEGRVADLGAKFPGCAKVNIMMGWIKEAKEAVLRAPLEGIWSINHDYTSIADHSSMRELKSES